MIKPIPDAPAAYEIGRKIGATIPKPLIQILILVILGIALFVRVRKK